MHAPEGRHGLPHSALLLRIAALAAVGFAAVPARADQDDVAERVPSSAADVYSPIARSFARQPALPGGPISRPQPDTELPVAEGPVLLEDFKGRLGDANPFFRDTIVNLYTRTHYLDRRNSDVSTSQAWAAGSALAVRSGYLDDWLQLEAAVATSQPVFAPSDEGGTLLLTDQQAEVSSLAVANARMRLLGQEVVLGRQLVKTPYINPQDNRMIPNTVEGVVLTRPTDKADAFDYGVGYLWGFKARDSSYFVPFSNELGVTEDRGVAVAGFKMVPLKGLTFGAIDYHIADTLNTAYAEVDWLTSPGPGLQFRVSVNYTDQRSVGEDLMTGAPFATSQISGLVAASYCNATLLAAISSNGTGADLSGPFGSFPAYTVLDQLNFNDAGEMTVVVGAAYDFSQLITDGLRFQARYGRGSGIIDPATGAPQPKQNELNFELVYQPTSGPLENLYFQFFYSGVKMPGAPAAEENQPQVRSVITYLVPVL
jgi:outer membrane porin, OprD family